MLSPHIHVSQLFSDVPLFRIFRFLFCVSLPCVIGIPQASDWPINLAPPVLAITHSIKPKQPAKETCSHQNSQ